MNEDGEKSITSEISKNDKNVINNEAKLKNGDNDSVVSRVIEVFDGEILR